MSIVPVAVVVPVSVSAFAVGVIVSISHSAPFQIGPSPIQTLNVSSPSPEVKDALSSVGEAL